MASAVSLDIDKSGHGEEDQPGMYNNMHVLTCVHAHVCVCVCVCVHVIVVLISSS